VYGTVLIDCESHAPIELLPDREADTLASWLLDHPGIEIICRDRSGAYADGAPHAQQVADVWHLWHNLSEAINRLVSKHSACLREPEVSQAAPDTDTETVPDEPPAVVHDTSRGGRYAERARRHHQAVHELLDQGRGIRAIGRHLNLSRHTVQRYARAATWEELVDGKWQNRPSALGPFKPYLHQRWQQGCTNGVQLHAELEERGYQGSYSTLRDYLQRFRDTSPGTCPPPKPPSVRQVTGWITRHPDRVREHDQQRLKEIVARCPELDAAAGHVRTFASLMTDRRGECLPEWINAVRADDRCGLAAFADGLTSDLDAVIRGLSTHWSSGPVEGRVNDIKHLKRQMFGRAGFPLLRKRVLLVAASRRLPAVTAAAAP
jgi:Transposase